jgi:hypothetical protein
MDRLLFAIVDIFAPARIALSRGDEVGRGKHLAIRNITVSSERLAIIGLVLFAPPTGVPDDTERGAQGNNEKEGRPDHAPSAVTAGNAAAQPIAARLVIHRIVGPA